MKIKYPRAYLGGENSCAFYTWYQETEDSNMYWSGWVLGDANSYYKIKKLKGKDFTEAIKKYSMKSYP